MDGYFVVRENDLIGWTSEGCIVPISYGDTSRHFTYYSDVIANGYYPRVDFTYTFERRVLLTFSVAVNIEPGERFTVRPSTIHSEYIQLYCLN